MPKRRPDKTDALFEWDCGLACIQNVLQFTIDLDYKDLIKLFQEYEMEKYKAILYKSWSLDYFMFLYWLLIVQRKIECPLKFSLCTSYLGVRNTFESEVFYQELIQDAERVAELFSFAHENELSCFKRVYTTKEFCSLAQRDDILMICCVNTTTLFCKHCDEEIDDNPYGYSSPCSCSDCIAERSFSGHFVIVVDFKDDLVYYRDSDADACQDCCSATLANFEASRKSFGTDEDMLLFWIDSSVKQSSMLTQKEIDSLLNNEIDVHELSERLEKLELKREDSSELVPLAVE